MSRERKSHAIETVSLDRRQFTVAAAASVAAVSTTTAVSRAQDMATPAAATPVAGVQLEVLATGLLDPRFVAVDGDTIYFTEAGNGGDLEVFEVAGEGTPAPAAPISSRGATGKLSAVAADGTITAVVDDFISYTFGENGEMIGPHGVAIDSGMAYVIVGGLGPYTPAVELTGEENALYEVDLATGDKRVIANLAEYELANNPDPMAVDSNPYGVAVNAGVAYVTDAGGNDILAVDIATGTITTFAVTGGVDGPFPNPNRAGEMQLDSVPTGIKLGPDGRLYNGYLTGGPFIPGLSKIDAWSADGSVETIATGLTTVTDVAFGPDGHLYAIIMSSNFLNQGPGQIVRVMADGAHMVVVDGLVFPNGMAFDAAGNLVITHKVSFRIPGGGELVRISGVTEEAGTPLVIPEFVMPEGGPPAEGAPEGTPAG